MKAKIYCFLLQRSPGVFRYEFFRKKGKSAQSAARVFNKKALMHGDKQIAFENVSYLRSGESILCGILSWVSINDTGILKQYCTLPKFERESKSFAN